MSKLNQTEVLAKIVPVCENYVENETRSVPIIIMPDIK